MGKRSFKAPKTYVVPKISAVERLMRSIRTKSHFSLPPARHIAAKLPAPHNFSC